MFHKALPTLFATLLLCLPTAAGWARGDAGAAMSSPKDEVAAPAPALADQVDALLTARFAAASDLTESNARRRALQELSSFASVTVEGLIDAAPGAEMRSMMDARLRPVLNRHQNNIAAALAALGERPSAQTGHTLSPADGYPHVATAP